jgi:AcrR family transcriptional regulator
MARAKKKAKKIKNRGWLRRHANIDTKKEILEASGLLFARHGYDGTSVVDIARIVGIKDASIYNHFDSKQEILYAFLCQILDDLVIACTTAVEMISPCSAPQKLRKFVEAHVGFLVDNLEVTPLVDAYTYRSVKIMSDEQADNLMQYERTIINLLKDILQEGVDEGEFRIDDRTVTMFAVLGSIEHLVYWYKEGGRLSKKSLQKKLADVAIQTVTVKH